MDTADSRGAPGARYQRPYAVPERLDLLRGPSSGTIRLPSHLDWPGNAVYDLNAPSRVVDLYRAVLIEASWQISAVLPRPRERRLMEPRPERIAKIALVAGARYGLALAGGYTVSAHGTGTG
jgi:hypothetical protein